MTDPTNIESKRQPVERFSHGQVKCSIFENRGPKGAFRTASIQISYRSGNEWKNSNSYSERDLLDLEKTAKEAREKIASFRNGAPAPAA